MNMRIVMIALACVAWVTGASTSQAETSEPMQSRIAALSEVLKIGPLIEVLRDEGIAHGAVMQEEMFPGQGGAGWTANVALIYDTSAMRARFETAFDQTLAGSPHVDAIAAFFGSEQGKRIIALEIDARRAMLDPVVEQAAKTAFAEMQSADDPRVAALNRFAETNDLIETNVMGALNANLAFFQGMADGLMSEQAIPEDQMLADVWASEPDVRAETMDWLLPYLALAYKPLSDDDLQAYQAFSEGAAGQAVNAALFSAFDAVFIAVSRDLGRSVAQQMQGQEL